MQRVHPEYSASRLRTLRLSAFALAFLSATSSVAAEDTMQTVRQELGIERQKIAEQMRRLEEQMSEYKRQVGRLDDLEKRLNSTAVADGDLTGSTQVSTSPRLTSAGISTESNSVGLSASDQPGESVAKNRAQLLAGEGRSDPYVDEAFTKSAPLFGSPWRFSFGGYAKTDLLYDFSGTGNDQEFVLATIPVDDDPPKGSYSNTQISETRFHLESRNSDPAYADNRLYLEFDFFDEQNKTSTRLRHAYFQYGQLLAGRTWTLLTELRQLPLILDFAAGDSILGGRTEQIRWTSRTKDESLAWAVALENFNDSAIANPLGGQGSARSDFPRLAAGFTKYFDKGVWSTGGALTQLRFDGSDETQSATDIAYTLTTAGRIYLDNQKKNWLGLGIGHLSGSVTDVIAFANGKVSNATLGADGELDVAKAWNTQIGLHWNWNQTWTSNFSVAYARLTDVPDLFEPDQMRMGWAYHANLIYKYNDLISTGVEFMHGERENVSGRDGDAQRLQYSIFYYF